MCTPEKPNSLWAGPAMNRHQPYLFFSLGIMLAFLATLLFLDNMGRNSRVMGEGHPFNDAQVDKWTVGNPHEAYYLWKEHGFKGRIILTIGRRLSFAAAQREISLPDPGTSLEQIFEQGIKPENFLQVSLKTGIAREIIQAIPEAMLDEELRKASSEKGMTATNRVINAPYFGAPRTITTLSLLKPIREPMLVVINASIFRDYQPGELIRLLQTSGIATDALIFCRSLDDPEVTERERNLLKDFEQMTGAKNGKA